MSEPTSVVFKRSRTKHAQRSRVSTPNPGESQPELEAANGEVSPSTLATKLKNKVKARAQPKSPLSFGGNDEEGEEEVFKVRKSSLSQKLTLGKSTRIIPSSFEPTVASLN
ncbi:hypothetical protein A0H81_11197 [Grifola frondosa]|uniref:Uncharacterized protein n=1 Tax=Grifola frondosa TaxID=5627 RepID=A0A1C7LV31_GRIFR|nr:hypothetical protein A0H81_11197 [Grifola frondosa]